MGTVAMRECLRAILSRYRRACKKGMQAILDEFCHVSHVSGRLSIPDEMV
jgi:hypothetical protein